MDTEKRVSQENLPQPATTDIPTADKQGTTTDRSGIRLFLHNLVMLIATPFVAIAYSLALPFVGGYLFMKSRFDMFKTEKPAE